MMIFLKNLFVSQLWKVVSQAAMKPIDKDAVSLIIKMSSTRPALHKRIGFIHEAINFHVMLQNVYLNFSS